MILETQLIRETEKAKYLKFIIKDKEVKLWIPNSLIDDIEHHYEDMENFEIDIADWFCIKNGLDKI